MLFSDLLLKNKNETLNSVKFTKISPIEAQIHNAAIGEKYGFVVAGNF